MQNVRTANWFLYGTVLKEVYSTNPDKSNIKKERQEAVDVSWIALPNELKSQLLSAYSMDNHLLINQPSND